MQATKTEEFYPNKPGFKNQHLYRLEILKLDVMGSKYHGDWQRLANQALEPNVFYDPYFLIPALNNLGDAQAVSFYTVFRQTNDEKWELTGLMPVIAQKGAWGWPGTVLHMLDNPWITDNTPLIDARYVDETLRTLMDFVRHKSGVVWSLGRFPVHSVLGQKIKLIAGRNGIDLSKVSQHERAILKTDLDAETYLAQNVSKSRLKNLRRRKKRLAEKGPLTFKTLSGKDGLDIFLALEKSGWKGQQSTALDCMPQTRNFAKQAFQTDNKNSRVDILICGETPIASSLTIKSGQVAWAYKSAYNEDWASYSPSLLLDQHLVCDVLGTGWAEYIDSSSQPGNVLEDYWKERRTIAHLLFTPGTNASRRKLKLLTQWIRTFNNSKQMAKTTLSHMKKVGHMKKLGQMKSWAK